jgi:hypothetical protein
MKKYQSKTRLLPGTSYEEVQNVARKEHRKVIAFTKRQPYARSAYFNKNKVFLSVFWEHTMQKNRNIKTSRLKLYTAAIDLIRNSRHNPETIIEKNNPSILLHRFYGITKEGVEYCVQVKQHKRTGRLDLMSVFKRKSP